MVWRGVLISKTFQEKSKAVFGEEAQKDGMKLFAAIKTGNVEKVKKLSR